MNNRCWLFIASILLTGCFSPKPEELDRAIFIPDAEYPELPAYTEWGYNTFGAHFNDDILIYGGEALPVVAEVISDTLSIEFNGYLKNLSSDVQLNFKFANLHPSQYSDLVTLNATTIDLANSSLILTLLLNGTATPYKAITGQLQFKRAQYLLVNGHPDRVILSGYFDFQIISDKGTFIVKDGRFDFGIGEFNFYNY